MLFLGLLCFPTAALCFTAPHVSTFSDIRVFFYRQKFTCQHQIFNPRNVKNLAVPRLVRPLQLNCNEVVDPGAAICETITTKVSGNDFDISVRRSSVSQECFPLAQLRCSSFGQDQNMFNAVLGQMKSRPRYVLAGIYETEVFVAVARPATIEGANYILFEQSIELDSMLNEGWISAQEWRDIKSQMEFQHPYNSELIVGSIDCSILERLDEHLRLERSLYISSMSVRAAFRRRGVGHALLAYAEQHATGLFGPIRQLHLHVETPNTSALRLYASAGFRPADLSSPSLQRLERMMRVTLSVPRDSVLWSKALPAPAAG